MTGAELIAAERQRQIDKEGWSPKHDDEHQDGELAVAAACYAIAEEDGYVVLSVDRKYVDADDVEDCVPLYEGQDAWPWEEEDDKRRKHDRLRRLVIAGALIAAEIDRMQRESER
jgi:hypothetical protein